MKLRHIIEGTDQPVRQAAAALSDLYKYLQLNKLQSELKLFNAFLTKPTTRRWEQTRSIVKIALKHAANSKTPNKKIRMETWAALIKLAPNIVAASTVDMDPTQAKGTPLAKTALPKTKRDHIKKATGPDGFIATFQDFGNVNDSDRRRILRTIEQGAMAAHNAASKLPGSKRQSGKF
jgi:hypothetical protein